jgi:hypothetical protein
MSTNATRYKVTAYRLVPTSKGRPAKKGGRFVVELPGIEAGMTATLKGLGRIACKYGDPINGSGMAVHVSIEGEDHWRIAVWNGRLCPIGQKVEIIDAPMIIDPDNLPEGFVRRDAAEAADR